MTTPLSSYSTTVTNHHPTFSFESLNSISSNNSTRNNQSNSVNSLLYFNSSGSSMVSSSSDAAPTVFPQPRLQQLPWQVQVPMLTISKCTPSLRKTVSMISIERSKTHLAYNQIKHQQCYQPHLTPYKDHQVCTSTRHRYLQFHQQVPTPHQHQYPLL